MRRASCRRRIRCASARTWPSRRCMRAIAEADVVLAIGTEFGETEMYPEPQAAHLRRQAHPHRHRSGTIGARRCRRSADPRRCGAGGCGDQRSAGAVPRTAQARPTPPAPSAPRPSARRTPKHWWPAISLHQRIAKIVLEALPDAILAGDSTEPVYALNQCYRGAAAALLFQFQHRLRHVGLWPPGRYRRQACRA